METDKRAVTQWKKATISYQNYQDYLASKNDKFELTLIDLLFVSNFKGGNATINEISKDIESKLTDYSTVLKKISKEHRDKRLGELNDSERIKLKEKVAEICELTKKDCKTKIDGFSVSYLSALLSSFFPNLIPILDRRILLNLELVNKEDVNKQGQIKNIQKFYPDLIDEMYSICSESDRELRDVDEEIFTRKIKNDTPTKAIRNAGFGT
jgi:hypothetical protein